MAKEYVRKSDLKIESIEASIEKINKNVNSMNQSLEELIIPLLKKHENALFSEDGRNGLVSDIYRLSVTCEEGRKEFDEHKNYHKNNTTMTISLILGVSAIVNGTFFGIIRLIK